MNFFIITSNGEMLALFSNVPIFRYQNWLRMLIWLFFLFVYSQSVQQPIELQKDPHFDAWEIILYMMGLAYTIEGTYNPFSSSPQTSLRFE